MPANPPRSTPPPGASQRLEPRNTGNTSKTNSPSTKSSAQVTQAQRRRRKAKVRAPLAQSSGTPPASQNVGSVQATIHSPGEIARSISTRLNSAMTHMRDQALSSSVGSSASRRNQCHNLSTVLARVTDFEAHFALPAERKWLPETVQVIVNAIAVVELQSVIDEKRRGSIQQKVLEGNQSNGAKIYETINRIEIIHNGLIIAKANALRTNNQSVVENAVNVFSFTVSSKLNHYQQTPTQDVVIFKTEVTQALTLLAANEHILLLSENARAAMEQIHIVFEDKLTQLPRAQSADVGAQVVKTMIDVFKRRLEFYKAPLRLATPPRQATPPRLATPPRQVTPPGLAAPPRSQSAAC